MSIASDTTIPSGLDSDSNHTALASNNEVFSTETEVTSLEDYRLLGIKYLEFKLMKQVMTTNTELGLDSKIALETKLLDFPWQSAYGLIKGLVNTGVGQDLRDRCTSMREAYLVAAGMIQMSSNQAARVMLSASLRDRRAAIATRSPLASISSGAVFNAAERCDTPMARQIPDSSDDEMLPLYSMALNEHCQREGLSMWYADGKRLSLDPPSWQMAVSCGGKTWTAQAKQKAKAKQKAARMACNALDVQVDWLAADVSQ